MLGLLLAIHLATGGLVAAEAARKPTAGDAERAQRLKACMAKVETKPTEALEDAEIWARETHNREASVCKALAFIALKQIPQGARLLEEMADAGDGGTAADRAHTYSQAGNARLLDLDAAAAIKDFNAALKYAPKEPDLLIDRARAYAMISDWRKAEEDLSAALDQRKDDPLILSLRAETRLQQNVLDLAEADANAAVTAAPKDVEALLVRGRVRAARAGHKPD